MFSISKYAKRIEGYHTKADLAYKVIREAILSGGLAPGDHILLQTCAEELEMSAIPVREALRRLEQDGLIDIRPHMGARVRELPTQEIQENLLIREQLEALAVRLAAEYICGDIMDSLESLVARMDECIASEDLEEYGRLNRKFHLLIYSVVPYRRLYRLIQSLWSHVPRARSIFVLAPEYAKESQEAHRELLCALEERDGVRAETIIRRQKNRVRETIEQHHGGSGAQEMTDTPEVDLEEIGNDL